VEFERFAQNVLALPCIRHQIDVVFDANAAGFAVMRTSGFRD
jgi:hypothetical protein